MDQTGQAAVAKEAAFEPISVSRALDEIARQIRQEVMAGRLKPGQKLPPERDLCVRFGVSRNTLREALRALEISGLIELRKGATGGAFIKKGEKDVVITGLRDLYYLGSITPEQLTEARVMLSDLVVRDVCKKATEADLEVLQANVAAAEAAQKTGDLEQRARINLEFHSLLVRISGNPILSLTMEAILKVMGEFIAELGYSENRFVLPSRRRLLKLLAERNADEAAKEMAAHLHRVHRYYLSRIKSQD
ncbi:FadR/GntR family transcriptional regulator [Cupriavidus taiwanensis]|uniref:FadR/GntR family transcriptional regulator n=1 Tax=Cupriavidus taiwanensis TaxID=164546 RepID=UPI0034A02E0E